MMSNRFGLASLIGVTAICTLMAGCPAPTVVHEREVPRNAEPVESSKAQAPDDTSAAALRLLSEYREGIELLNAGDAHGAVRVLRGVSAKASALGITFAPEIERNLKKALSGEMFVVSAVEREAPVHEGTPSAPPGAAPSVMDITSTTETPSEPSQEAGNRARDSEADFPGVILPALSEPEMADRLISVDFNEVDIRIVLKTIGDITGVNFLVHENIQGTVTLISPTKIRLGEVYKVLESILEVKGYAAVPAGKIVKIVPRAEAQKRNLHTRVGSDPADIPRDDTVVTQIIPLRHASAAEVSVLIAPLVSTGSHVATYPRTNAIVLTDTSSNIHHIARIIQEFDVSVPRDVMSVIPLRYASAQVLSQQLTEMMEQLQSSAPGKGPSGRTGASASTIKVLPDARTNSLIVIADPKYLEDVDRLVKKLDVERSIEAGNIHVIYLKNATAKELAQSLSTAVGKMGKGEAAGESEPVHITADESTNALIITASPQDFKVIEDMIAKLDIVREQVLVEMRIVEASEDALKEIGVDWATLDPAGSGIRGFGYTNFGPRLESVTGDLEGMAVGAFKNVGGTVQIGAILKALESKSGVNILSTPHVLTSNHQEATILVGENIPYVKESRITETDPSTPTAIKTYDYKDVGITLKITPHVSQAELVRLEIDSQFTKLIETASGSVDTPTTAKREAKTVVTITSGATVVIGGLIRDDEVTVNKQVPLLGDIPGLGNLFKWKRNLVQKTNLLMFITPHVLTGETDLARMTERKAREVEPPPSAKEQTRN